MDAVVLLIAIVSLLLGLAIGWGLAGRGAGVLRGERDAAQEKAARALAELAVMSERGARVDAAEAAQATARGERDAARERLAALEAGLAERERAFSAQLGEVTAARDALALRYEAADGARQEVQRRIEALEAGLAERERANAAQLAQLMDAKEALSRQFGEVGATLLEAAQRQFLERADQRFHQAGEASEAKLKALLTPMADTLTRHREEVARIERERTEAYGNLTGLIDAMRTGQEAVRGEAARLVNALRAAPKARGRWGEQQLRNVLETCGLSEHADFAMEVSVGTEDGRLRPDAVIRVPGGRALVVDAKVSLNAYQDAHGALDEGERARHLAGHAAAMKAHVTGLGAKAYWDQFADAPDYVVMFVPGEHFLSAALEQDPTLWDYAFGKRVLLATPTNLIAIARTIAAVWRQEKMAEQARRIGALGKEMHERLATASTMLRTVGGGLSSAVANYNKFVASFEGRVMVTGRKFAELNVETGGKELPELLPVEALPRYGEAAE